MGDETKRCSRCGAEFAAAFAFCGIDGTPLDTAPEPGDEWIGQVLEGRFAISRLLAEGGMGRVYEAVQQPLGRAVAVKVVHAKDDARTVARFLREIKIVGRLNHPNLVTLYDYGQTPQGDLYFVMELIKGTTLEEELRERGPIALERAVALFGDMCSALDAAHGAGVIHRDFKPANVMLVDSGHRGRDIVKVLDFGIATEQGKSTAELTRTGFVCGTPRYMSPEQAAGTALDHRSDVYALGLVLYEMLAGVPPFQAVSPVELMQAHMGHEPPPLATARSGLVVPAELEAALRRSLAKSPGARPSTAWSLRAEVLGAMRPASVPVVGRTVTDLTAVPQSTSTGTIPAALKAERIVHGVAIPSYEAKAPGLSEAQVGVIDAALERCATAVRASAPMLCIVRVDEPWQEPLIRRALLERKGPWTWRPIDAGSATSGSSLASHVVRTADHQVVQLLYGLPAAAKTATDPFYQGLDRLGEYYEGGLGPCLVILAGEPQLAGLKRATGLWAAVSGESGKADHAAVDAVTPVNRIPDSLEAQASHLEQRLTSLADGVERARTKFRLAEIRGRQRRWSECVALGSHAARSLRDGQPRELALACELVALASEHQGDLKACSEWLGQASDAWNATGEMVQVARLCAWSGAVSARLGYRTQARTSYETAAQLERALGRKVHEAAALRRLGALEEAEGRADVAETRYRAALDLSLGIKDAVGASRAYHYLGVLAQRKGRFEEARTWHGAALELDERSGDRPRVAGSLHQLGSVLVALRDPGGARACFERSLGIARELGDHLGIAMTLRRIGDMELRQSNWAEAVACYSESEERLVRLGSPEKGGREAELRFAHAHVVDLGAALTSEPVWRERSLRSTAG